jgi:molybdenum cofactor cytidylyltransferase
MISGIILGAGASRRMGVPKQPLDLGGKAMIQHVLDVFTHSSLDEVVLVLSPALEWKPKASARLKVVLNPHANEGISSSVRVAMDGISAKSEAVVIGLADKPFLSVSTIEALVEAYRRSPSEIVVPVFRGKRGNPILFRRNLFRQLGTLNGDVGAKVLVESKKYSVEEVPVEDEGVLFDVDTPADLRKAKKMLAAWSGVAESESRK